MKTSTIATLVGIGAFSAGCAATAYACAEHVKHVDDKFTGLHAGMKFIEDNISLDIPEDVASELVKSAAKEIATEQVKKASEAACKEITKDMKNVIKGNVANAYSNIEDTLKNKLEKEINLQTIERIESKVSEKVAKQILINYANPFAGGTTKADIAKACIDNGMDGFDVARVMSSIK